MGVLRDEAKALMAPVLAMAERLSAVERYAIENAAEEIDRLLVEAESQERATAEDLMSTHMELDDAEEELREMRRQGSGANHDEDPGHPAR